MPGWSRSSSSTVPRTASKVGSHGVSIPTMPWRSAAAWKPARVRCRESRLPLVDRGRRSQQGDTAMTELGQVVHTLLGGSEEVQVDTGQSVGVGRDPDQHRRHRQLPQQRHPLVVQLDVHHHQRVDEGALRDSLEPGAAFVSGQQQDVVVVPAGGRDDRCGELHQHGHVHPGPQRDHQGEHVRPVRGERAGTRVGPVAQHPHRFLHAVACLDGDRPLAAENIGHRAGRHPGLPRDVGNRDDGCLPGESSAGRSASISQAPASSFRCRMSRPGCH